MNDINENESKKVNSNGTTKEVSYFNAIPEFDVNLKKKGIFVPHWESFLHEKEKALSVLFAKCLILLEPISGLEPETY